MRQKTVSNIDVFILCGGEGKRLRSVVSDKPKAMADIGGRPFLERIIENLVSSGFGKIILGVGHLRDQIIGHFSVYRSGVFSKIEFSEEEYPLGTGGAVKKAKELIKGDHFMVMNGDVFLSLDFGEFYSRHLENDSLLTMALADTDDVGDYGSVELDKDGRIVSFREKLLKKENGLINAGAYLMKREIFSHMPERENFSLEQDLFPEILKTRRCCGFVGADFLDIGVPERYEAAKRLFSSDTQ